ncbi:hypothetical protein M5689_014368 [Euphorbia peplus]|nr:hypothetical protein M5689_014368 [Euphorbia peplus]
MGSSSVFLKTNNLIGPRLVVRPYLYYNTKRYSKSEDGGGGEKERAPSLAQEFRRVEEEKAADHDQHEQEQGLASQTVDKAYDGADEAVHDDGDVHSVKDKFKEHEPAANYRRND